MTDMRRRPVMRAVVVTLLLVLQAGVIPPQPAAADDTHTTITLTASAASSYRDEDVVLRAVVSPNPGGGEVRFYDTTDDDCLCSYWVDPATGEAAASVRIWDLGTRQLKAVFTGHDGFAASESELLAHDVLLRPSSVTLEIGPINEVGDVELTTTVAPHDVGGTVSIQAASGEVLVADGHIDTSDGIQTRVWNAPLPGTGPYTASYSGTSVYAPSTSDPVPWSDDRMTTTTTLEVTPGTGAPYDTWTWDVKVDPADWGVGGPMDGVVRLYRPGEFSPWATIDVSGNGVARHTASITVPGTHAYYAVYSGDDDYVGSRSSEVSVTAERIPVTTTLELSAAEMHAGESVVATVTIDPPPSVWPPDPAARLKLTSGTGEWHVRQVAIDPETGIGQATISADELSPEVWSVVASFASDWPVSNRYEPSTSEPVELRYEPAGPRHALSIGPSLLYPGDPATVTLQLTPAPTGGTVELFSTDGTVGKEPVLLGTAPAAGTVSFEIAVASGLRYFTRFSGSADQASSRSAELIPTLVWPPRASIAAVPPWTTNPSTSLSFGIALSTVQPATPECSLDGGAWFVCSSSYTTPVLADGRHTFRVRAIDGNGRVQDPPSQVAWRIDRSAPVITSATANGGRAINESTGFVVPVVLGVSDQALGVCCGWHRRWSASPAVDEDGLLINHSGPTSVSSPTAPFDWDVAQTAGGQPAEGLHRLYVQLRDPLGWWSEVSSVTIRHDASAPKPKVVVNGGEHATARTDVAVTVCCVGADPSGIAEMRVSSSPRTTGGLLADAKTMSPRSSLTWDIVDPAFGGVDVAPGFIAELGVYVQWRDRAGNWSAVGHDTVRVHVTGFDADHPYVDSLDSKFASDIAFLFRKGWTSGCSVDRFCPDGYVTRGQMAAFLARALKLPATTRDFFTDDATSKFQSDINRLAASGITGGCGGGRFCPGGLVTRGQMAAFLHRALR